MNIGSEFAQIISKGLVNSSLDRCSRWSMHRIIMPKPVDGPLKFDKFPWQETILDCEEEMVSIRKGAQLGFSVAGIIKALHRLDARREDVLYILPTDRNASQFAQARLDSIVQLSPHLANLFVGANSVGLKKTVHPSHMYIKGSMSEANLVSVPVGTVVIDEYDRCNVKALSLALERMSAYERRHLFALSTPTLPEFGIDGLYQRGTQEEFTFKCPSCSKHIALRWPESFEVCGDSATDPDTSKSHLKCYECQAPLPHETKNEWLSEADWVPQQKATGHRSFSISQLYSFTVDPQDVAQGYHRGCGDEVAMVEFMNQKIGAPYIMAGGKITDEEINRNFGSHHKSDASVPGKMVTMGVDVGSFLDVAIVEYDYDEDPWFEPHLRSRAKLIWEGRLPGGDFTGLDGLMSQYQIRHCCIDFQPETNLAKSFARRFHGFVSLVQYRKGTEQEEIKEKEDDRVPILTVNRTAFLDYSVGRLHRDRLSLPLDLSSLWKEHVKSIARTYMLDEYGKPKAVYVSNKPDHACHALALAEVAHIRAFESSYNKSVKF